MPAPYHVTANDGFYSLSRRNPSAIQYPTLYTNNGRIANGIVNPTLAPGSRANDAFNIKKRIGKIIVQKIVILFIPVDRLTLIANSSTD